MTWHTNKNSTPSTSLQEQEAAFSLTSYLDTIRLERAKSNPTQEMSSSPDNETESCQPSPSGTTYAHSTEHPGEEQLMFFAEASPVRTSVQQVKEQELQESVRDFGRNMRDSLERCGLALSLPKTHLCFALGDLELSSKTWPRWGIMLDGECSELGTLKHRTKESECGLWVFTPLCKDVITDCPSERLRSGPHMESQVKMILGISVERKCWLNPSFSEKVMGWPSGWTDLKPLETDKFPCARLWHSLFSQKD